MPLTDALPGPPPPEDLAVHRRDRLLAALLLDDPSLLLLRYDAALAHALGESEPYAIVVLTAPPGASAEAIRASVRAMVKAVVDSAPPTHFVVVGGGDAITAAVKSAAPLVQTVRFGFHHLTDAATLVHVTGTRLPRLESAAARVDEPAPGGADPIAAALERGRAIVQQQSLVAAKLGGSNRVTAVLAGACVALLALSYAWGADVHDVVLRRMGANIGAEVRAGQVYRLLASAFLHADLVHLGFNMVALLSIGPFLESLLGPRRYLVLYAASALGGALASTFFGGERWSVGASGAIWGLMAAGVSISYRPKGLLPPLIIAGMKRRAIAPVVINLAYSLRPGVDMLAHIGGGVVGAILVATVLTDGLVPVAERPSKDAVEKRPSPVYAVASWIAGAAMALSVIVAFVAGRPFAVNDPPVLQRTALGDTGLSIELPSSLAGARKDSREGGVQVFTFGRLIEAPVIFEIIVGRLDHEVTGGELDGLLVQERKALDEHSLEGATPKGPSTLISIGGRPALRVEHALKGLSLDTYLLVVGRYEVLVRGYSAESRPASWAGVEGKVAATVTAK